MATKAVCSLTPLTDCKRRLLPLTNCPTGQVQFVCVTSGTECLPRPVALMIMQTSQHVCACFLACVCVSTILLMHTVLTVTAYWTSKAKINLYTLTISPSAFSLKVLLLSSVAQLSFCPFMYSCMQFSPLLVFVKLIKLTVYGMFCHVVVSK